ncbi:MAG: hypothetical protein ACYC6L_08525 [Anaerolineae bacterium]
MPFYEKPILRRETTELLLFINYSEKERAKVVGSYRWDPDRKCWVYPATRRIYDALVAEFGDQLDIQITSKPDASPGNTKNTPKPAANAPSGQPVSGQVVTAAATQPDSNISARLAMLADEVERLKTANRLYEEQVPVLFEQIRQMSENNTILRNEKQSVIKQRDDLRLELDRSRQQNSSGHTVDSLIAQLRQREAQLAQFEHQLDQSQALQQRRSEELAEYKRKCATWEAKYTDTHAELVGLRAQKAKSNDNSMQTRIKYVALEATENNESFANLLDHADLDDSLPIKISRTLELKLRVMLNIPEDDRPQLNDLLAQASDSAVLPRDAIDLAHIIRKQRNIIAHSENDEPTCQARAIICLFAAALLWPEFDS